MIVDITSGSHRTECEIGYTADVCFDLSPRDRRTIRAEWSSLPLRSVTVDLAIFDPPHQVYGHGEKSWLVDRYASFENGAAASESLERAFAEIRRVLKSDGSCLLKWSTNHKPLRWIVKLSKMKPRSLFVERSSLSAHPEKPFSHQSTVYWAELT